MRLRPTALALALLVAHAALPARAIAQAPPPVSDQASRAAELKKQGDTAMESGRPAEAYAAYQAAYALSPDPALLYNKGRALQALTQYPEALAELEKFAATAPPELKARVPGLDGLLGELRSKVSTLTIACDVDGAKVTLRERVVATTPVPGPMKVNAGPAVLDVSKEGYMPYHKELVLPGGGLATIEVHLLSKATAGVLVVTSPVAGADVSIDDKTSGTVPLETVLLAGPHKLVLTRDGYEPATTSAVIGAGERKTVSIPLEAVKPITTKWWFWTGVGVVAAGAAALIYALTTERKADSGTIPPGQVGAALVRW